MSADQSNFDNNTLALLNRIANNRRTNLAPEAILLQPARATGAAASATRSKQHALFGAPDGGSMRRTGATEAPHRPGTAQVRDPFHRTPAVRPATAAQGARNAAASRTTGSSLRAAMPMVADDAAHSAFSSAAGGLWAGMQASDLRGGGGDGGGGSCSCGSHGGSQRGSRDATPTSARRGDGINFTEAPFGGEPGLTVMYRSPAEKLADPERLNLDRRGLTGCPVLEGEERLRLLNYQNNAIAAIGNLRGPVRQELPRPMPRPKPRPMPPPGQEMAASHEKPPASHGRPAGLQEAASTGAPPAQRTHGGHVRMRRPFFSPQARPTQPHIPRPVQQRHRADLGPISRAHLAGAHAGQEPAEQDRGPRGAAQARRARPALQPHTYDRGPLASR